MFAAEGGVDTTWCRGAINSEREVARFWRLLRFGMEDNIRDLQSSLEMLVRRGIEERAGRQAGKVVVAEELPQGLGVGQQSGLMGGVGRAASVKLGVETKQTRNPRTRASETSTVQGAAPINTKADSGGGAYYET